MRDTGLIAFLCGQAWALHRPVLESACAIMRRRLEGEKLDQMQVQAIVAERDRKAARRMGVLGEMSPADEERGYAYRGNVAVVPVSGVLSKYSDMINGMSQPSGMTSAQVADAVRRAGGDRRAASILMDIDSPGGTVAGTTDMVAAVHEARAEKPVVAIAHDMAASAAYWLASAADTLYLTPAAEVGSIGVYSVMEDASAYYEKSGVKRYLVASGEHKGAGAEGTKITADHLASIQDSITAMAQVFKDAVAQARGLSGEALAAVTTGRCFVGAEAVDVGLADGVMGVEDLLALMNEQAAA